VLYTLHNRLAEHMNLPGCELQAQTDSLDVNIPLKVSFNQLQLLRQTCIWNGLARGPCGIPLEWECLLQTMPTGQDVTMSNKSLSNDCGP